MQDNRAKMQEPRANKVGFFHLINYQATDLTISTNFQFTINR